MLWFYNYNDKQKNLPYTKKHFNSIINKIKLWHQLRPRLLFGRKATCLSLFIIVVHDCQYLSIMSILIASYISLPI